MGVIKKEDDVQNSNIINVAEGDPPIDVDVCAALKKSPKKTKNRSPKPTDFTKNTGRKAIGSRNGRRFENMNYLLSLVDNEEFGELDITDFVEPNITAFAELLMEQDKMNVWNDFINHSEEEQAMYLDHHTYSDICQETNLEPTILDNQTCDENENKDIRKVHPAFSAEESFKGIDARLRSFLQRRHLPMGILTGFEEELINFFHDWPEAVYVSKLSNSFERLLLHALCQYLDLASQSFNSGGMRQTQVENNNEEFKPPDVSLSQYLTTHCHQHCQQEPARS